MTKRQKGRQYNDQKTEGQTIQRPKEKGQTDKQTNNNLQNTTQNLKIE